MSEGKALIWSSLLPPLVGTGDDSLRLFVVGATEADCANEEKSTCCRVLGGNACEAFCAIHDAELDAVGKTGTN